MTLTRKEIDRRRREKCKKLGLCNICGKVNDRKGYYYCSSCKEKESKRKREDRELCIKNHICTHCKKERTYGDEKTCFLCKEKDAIRRSNYTEEKKEKYKKITIESAKRQYRKRIDNGICPICKKRKIEEGRRKCRICLNKDAEYHRMRRIDQQNIREYREKNNLCYFCGKPLDTKTKACSECAMKLSIASNRKKVNRYWNKENNLIFKNN